MGRGEVSEIIGGSSPELKVAGPSMLGIGCPGLDDGAILGPERLGEAEQERLLIAVVLIFGIGQRTRRRHHRQESGSALYVGYARLEIGDVALQLGRSGIGYCASDDRPPAARALARTRASYSP